MFVVLSGVVLLAAIGAAVARWQARTADLFERAALCLALGILIDFWMMLTGQPIGRVLAVGAALGVAGIWQVAVTQRRTGGWNTQRASAWSAAAAVYLLTLYWFRILSEPIQAWDARSIWFFHARMIWLADGLRHAGWNHPSIVFSNPDYPKLVAALAAQLGFAHGFWNEFFPKASLWLVLIPAVLWVFAFRRRTISFALLVLMLFVSYNEWLSNGYMDGYLAIYSGIVLLFAGRFLRGHREFDLQSACCALGIVCSLKNEGLLFALCAAAGVALAAGRRLADWTRLVAALRDRPGRVVVPVLAFGPALTWSIYKAAWGLQNPITAEPTGAWTRTVGRLTDGSSPQYILDVLLVRANGLWVAAAVASMLMLYAWRGRRQLHPGAVAATIAAVLHFCGMFVVYLSTPAELTFHLTTSAFRTMASTRVSLLVAIFFVLADLERPAPVEVPGPAAVAGRTPSRAGGVAEAVY